MAKTEELAKAGPVAITRPDYIPASSSGLEELSMKDMVLPRLTLCQSNSHARDKNDKTYIKGLEEGQFFNSLTGQIYGEKIQIVPLFFYHSRIMFRDMKEGGGIICQAPDGKKCQLNSGGPCLHDNWGPQGQPPECSEFFNYPALVYEGPGTKTKDWVVVSLKTTGLKAGRTLNSLMRLRGTAAYAGVYELSSVADHNQAGQSYYTWVAKNGNPPFVDLELYKEAEKLSNIISMGLRAGTITVDVSSLSDDAFAGRDSEV